MKIDFEKENVALQVDFETGKVSRADDEEKGLFCAWGGGGDSLRQAIINHLQKSKKL